MNVKVEIRSENSWHRVLAIEVPAEDAAQEYERVARKIATKVRLPGFRQGKVPLSVVRKSFKEDVDREFVESIVPVAFNRALQETKLDPITEPKFDELSFGETRPLSFTAEFDCRPELEIQGHKGIAIDKEIPEVPESAIEEVLEDFRKTHAELIDVEREAILGDVLLLDYQAIDVEGRPIPNRAARNFSLELGVGQVVETFEAALRGAHPGDVRIAEVPFAEDHPDPLLAGKSSRYKIKVRKVRRKSCPAWMTPSCRRIPKQRPSTSSAHGCAASSRRGPIAPERAASRGCSWSSVCRCESVRAARCSGGGFSRGSGSSNAPRSEGAG